MKAPARSKTSVALADDPSEGDEAAGCAVVCEPGDHAPDIGVDSLDVLFKGFADPTRLRILNVLVPGELCVCDIVELLELPQPAVSRHLAYLRRSGLVDATREWKYAHYRLAAPLTTVHANLLACVRSCFVGIASLGAERARAESRVRARSATPC